MVRQSTIGIALALALSLTVSFAHGQARGKGEEKNKGREEPKAGEKSKGRDQPKSAENNKGRDEPKAAEKPRGGEKPAGESRGASKAPGGAWSEGKKNSQATGAEGAAAGAAAKRNNPGASGAEGAAAGAAAAKRKNPGATGAEGAAAGAAAAKRNNPAATGAEGAAAGAAAANRNKPAATGAEGAAAGAAAANRNQPNATGAAGYAAVRNSFDHPHVYNEQWYADHQGAWSAANWAAGTAWTVTSLAAVGRHSGYANSTPVSYGYGDNVIYQEGNVIVDGQNAGTAEEFSQQAADLALLGMNAKEAATDEWLPLGVFALVRNEDQHPQTTVQLAINQQGILRGNYTDLVSDHTQTIQGSVDKETQRAAWTVGSNKNFFMEAGLKNLTDGEAPALIHKYSKTECWLLVRLSQPDQEGNVPPDPSSGK